MKVFTLLLIFTGFAFNSYATNPISPNAINFEKTIKVDKKMNKMALKFAKLSKTKVGKWILKRATRNVILLNKAGLDLQESVQKWLWFAIFGIVGGTILMIIAIKVFLSLSYFAWLVILAGLVCFWYWVYLKFLA